MKKILQITIMFLIPSFCFAQEIFTLEKSINIALQKSFGIKNAEYSLLASEKSLEAFKASLFSKLDLEFDIPSYSKSLVSQFNPAESKEEFYELGSSRIEGRLSLNQPLIFSNGNINVVGRIFGREQFGTNLDLTKDYYTNVSVSLNQPLFTFNTQWANLERSEINLKKAARNYTYAEQNLIYDVKSAFYNLYRLKESLSITQEKVKQNEESYQTAQNKFYAGLIAEVEALQLEVDLAASKNDLLNSKRTFEEGKNNFKILLGLELENDIDIISNLLYEPLVIDDSVAIASALKNRSDLLNQENDIYLSKLNVNEVDSRKNIKIVLNARYGISNNDSEFQTLFDKLLDDIYVALTLSVPVWDWGKTSRDVEVAETNLLIEKLAYQYLEKTIKNDVIATINKINSAKARVEVLSKSVEIAEKSYNISVERFKSGTISSFDLAQMQLRLTEAKNNSIGALIDYNLAVADLERKTYKKYQ
ncbi:MAG: TolC family protein [Bacteroidetes bacterium]|nr:TolC family protein [Bacteroidota bacterium]MBU1115879.1 TolC family protein [Bacteroidota bacterium]MBU1797993.1 TolC family protein [Bacteroidota bacterium]